jgi:hypothetical protein
MTLLALHCSAKINVASPLTINLKPWQIIPNKKRKIRKKPNKNRETLKLKKINGVSS